MELNLHIPENLPKCRFPNFKTKDMSRAIKNPFERKQKGILYLIFFKQLVFIVLFLPIACTKEPPVEKPPVEKPVAGITMTTLAPGVSFYIELGIGTDNLVIDWGDGGKSNANDAYSHEVYANSELYRFSHNYSDAPEYVSEHRITITGDNIELLNCRDNQLTTLDINHCPKLQILYCSDNLLTTLDASQNTALEELSCGSNQLITLDVNKTLKRLECYNNQLTTLDISHNTVLWYLVCDGNQLIALDVSHNTGLSDLECDGNQLTTLDVSRNTELIVLRCSGNQLTTLDMSHNTELTYLICSSNQLTTLDVTHNAKLYILYCRGNQLSTSSLNDLFRTLPDRTNKESSGILLVSDNPGENDCDYSIASGKKWVEWFPGPKSVEVENPEELYLKFLKQFINNKNNQKYEKQ